MKRLFLACVVVCASCLDPTQIKVTIDTSYKCEAAPTDVALWIGDESHASGPLDNFTATKSCTSGMTVGDIVVVPRKSVNDAVWVRVLAGLNGTDPRACSQPAPDAGPDGGTSSLQCIEAKRILRFVAHSKLEVSITLDSACINVRCPNASETCIAGKCVDAHVDPSDAAPPDSGAVDSGDDSAPVFKPAVDLFGSFDDVCATAMNGPYCWGSNASYQLGPLAGKKLAAGPTQIPLPANIKTIAVGDGHICATDGAEVRCWGSGSAGQLGRMIMGMTDPQPGVVNGLPATGIASLVAGGMFNCVLAPKPFCWGQMLPNVIDYGGLPKQIPQFDFTQISAGEQHVCGLFINNVWCWGNNGDAQLGVNPMTYPFSAAPLGSALGAGFVTCGFAHGGGGDDTRLPNLCNFACDVGWGSSAGGELGGTNMVSPAKRLGTASKQLAFGKNHMCAIEANGVRCRGTNKDGQCGMGNPDGAGWITIPLPYQARQVVAGRTYSCALTMGGHVYCWGTIAGVMSMQSTPAEVLLP